MVGIFAAGNLDWPAVRFAGGSRWCIDRPADLEPGGKSRAVNNQKPGG